MNSSTAKTRQIFTIFHELWHLFLRNSSIDFLNKGRVINYYSFSSRIIEIQANKFASEFLFPTSEFKQIVSQYAANEKTFSDLSMIFSVSKEVILRRYLDNEMVSQSEYDALTAKWAEEQQNKKKSDKKVQVSYYYRDVLSGRTLY